MAGASCFLPFVTRLDSSLLLAPTMLVLRAVFGWAVGAVTMLVLMPEIEQDGVRVRAQKPHGLPSGGNTQFICPGMVLSAHAVEAYVVPSPSLPGRSCLKRPVTRLGEITWLLEQ